MLKTKFKIWKLVTHAILCLSLFLIFMPFYIMIITSLKNETQLVSNFWGFPSPVLWNNYIKAWGAIYRYFMNSFIVTILTIIGITIVSVPAGYAFSKFKFKGKEALFYIVLAFSMIPSALLLIPMYVNILSLNLSDNYLGVILPNIATGCIISILLSRSFFEALPDSIFESAKLDGANEFVLITNVVLPLSKPIIGTIAVFNFFTTFNQYMWPFIVLSSDKYKTIPIGLAKLSGQYGVNFGFQMAGYTIAVVPLVIIFLLTSKLYVDGITAGAIKS